MPVELTGGGIQTSGHSTDQTPSIAGGINWNYKKYKIHLENGASESLTGISNGLFALSDDGVLTHLQTGYRVARFPDRSSGEAASDYLTSVYAEEFGAPSRAFRKSMTYDQYRALPEAVDLNRKISGDPDFNRLLVAAGVGRTGDHR